MAHAPHTENSLSTFRSSFYALLSASQSVRFDLLTLWAVERGELMKYQITHYGDGENFFVEALTKARVKKLIEAECANRCWIVDDTWSERVDEEESER